MVVARHFGSVRDRDKQRELRVAKVVVLANGMYYISLMQDSKFLIEKFESKPRYLICWQFDLV